MAQKNDIGRLVKDPEALRRFLDNALCGEVERRVVMIVGNRIVGDSRVLKSALSLAERGFEVVLIGMRPLPNDFSCGFIEGIPFLLVDGAELSTGADAAGHAAAMRSIGQRVARGLGDARFSILYTHDYWGLELGLHVMQGHAYRQMLHWVHDVHEYIEGYRGILPEGRLGYAIDAERRYLGLPDQLVFVNERIADLLCARFDFVARDRLVVHNAPRRQRDCAFQLRREIGLAPEVPLGVYLGRATAARGLDVLIPALEAIGELHFALLSSAALDYLAELRSLAEKAGVGERLHIFDYVPDAEVASAVASATFGISPLTRYGNSDLAVPTKVLEFLHAELPMVVSDATFQADFVREHRLGEVFSSTDA
ncbi:MAG TPA: glycosyltransferase, partial [Burkholderiaceae bacterium]|nr:glycosyltransferase [Burkholderiaceae bacterium]